MNCPGCNKPNDLADAEGYTEEFPREWHADCAKKAEARKMPPPCIHGDGIELCLMCQAQYDYDPSAYIEFGQHFAGEERWRELEEELARDAASRSSVPDNPSIPF